MTEHAGKLHHTVALSPLQASSAPSEPLAPKIRLELPKNGALNGRSDFELGAPSRPGDVVTARARFAGVTQRQGSRGLMVMVTNDVTLTNQKGEYVGTVRGTVIYF